MQSRFKLYCGILIGSILSSCGHQPVAGSHVQVATANGAAAAKLEGAAKPFGPLTYTPPYGSQTYTASLLQGGCGTAHLGLLVEAKRSDENSHFTACLDVTDGRLAATNGPLQLPSDQHFPGRKYSETLTLPVASGHYFDYLVRLQQISYIVSIFGQVEAVQLLKNAQADLDQRSDIDAIADSNWRYNNDGQELNLDFKISQPRDLIVTFGDDRQTYEVQRRALLPGKGNVRLKVNKPDRFDYRDSAAMHVYLVPSGAAQDQALAQMRRDLGWLCKESIRFWPRDAAATLRRGQTNVITASWGATKARTLILRLAAADGRLISERTVAASATGTTGSNDSAPDLATMSIDLMVPAALALGNDYTLEARLVPEGSGWDDKIAGQSKAGLIRIR